MSCSRSAPLTWLVAAVALVAGTGGCEAKSSLSGIVSYDGKVIEEGTVRLFPVNGTLGKGAAGNIVRGEYSIPVDAGLPPGTYSVVITALRETGRWSSAPEVVPIEFGGSGKLEKRKEVVQYIPKKYNRASELEIELVSGDNSRDFQLEK